MNELIGLYTSDEQVDRLLSARSGFAPSADPDDGQLSSTLLKVAERDVAQSPLGVVGQLFELDREELRALLVVLAPELDLRYATIFGYLNDDVARRHATVDLVERLALVRPSVLARDSRLVGQGIVRVLHDAHSPRRGAAVVASEPVRGFVVDSPLVPSCPPRTDEGGVTIIIAGHREAVDYARERAAQGRRELVEVARPPRDQCVDDGWRDTFVGARLRGAIVYLAPEATGLDGRTQLHVSPHSTIDVALSARVTTYLGAASTSAWHQWTEGCDPRVTVIRCGKSVRTGPLDALARRVDTTVSWSDLAVPVATAIQLGEFASAIRHREMVFRDWGLDRSGNIPMSLRALFSGPPGTGKTLAASVIANSSGLALYCIDLSAIVSKYIGETEKNLEQIFSAAEHTEVILFFDEADALFGKRSEVRDSHDRYSNIELAYLLQRMERHDGVMILATNLTQNIDEAFRRRIHVAIDFPAPDETIRSHLWQIHMPSGAPLSDDIDISFLARQFALTGGDIHNAVLAAAFLAAHERVPISMSHLIRTVARQRRNQGKVASAGEFREYLTLVRDDALSNTM